MIEQGTPEWHEARRGKVTASKINDIMATRRDGKPAASYANYMADLIAERLSGSVAEGFSNAAMQWGTDTEPLARGAYSYMRDVDVEEAGFVLHPTIADTGASPDGLVGDDGLVEIKCPNTATHLATLDGAKIDRKYLLQMQWQMECTGREWCDFVSFDPRLPPAMQLHCQRVERDDDLVGEIKAAVIAFLKELRDREHRLRAKYMPEPVIESEAMKLMAAG